MTLPIETARGPSGRMSVSAVVAALNNAHAESDAEAILADARARYRGEIALVSSFGAESAVLLHMLSRIDPTVPVLFLETGMLFPETLAYQRDLARRFGLSDVRIIRPDPADIATDAPAGEMYRENPEGCCFLRKTLPLRRALTPFAAWVTGRKRHQTETRATLDPFGVEAGTGRVKVTPLAAWTPARLAAHMRRHDLPPHPLVAKGYPSIGCAPCTTPVQRGEDARAGRWRGRAKTECGIHFDGERWVRRPAARGAVQSFP